MTLSLLLTSGLSQDNTLITIPEEQVKALLADAQKYKVCSEEVILQDSIMFKLNHNIGLQDSIISALTDKVNACEELIDENKCNAWIKYVYAAGGIALTIAMEKALGE